MVVLDKNTNSFNVVLRDFNTNRGKIKVLNSIEDSSTYVFDFLITDVNKGVAEVSFVSNENETSLLNTVDFGYITNGEEVQRQESVEDLTIDLFKSPKNSYYIIEILQNEERLWYGQLIITDEEDLQEYKTYKKEGIIKL